ncbi:DUF2190 family protein [Planctomyces sp. SH-PL14]|uniref:DUF2190 family protein n=1 Tax=Planctomyces sp. SH-PL14 TaxID=1632864 RepID=UPI00078D1955|nr:DUF2190 family protein [Planctomyces sp. SH-PL14]AMV18255.1 hypothetical protein VT03_10225 [Planctomyces sp. SH-PL14]
MPQAFFHQGTPLMVDHTPGGAVAAGDVVVTADSVRIAHLPIAAGDLGALAAGGGVYMVAGDAAIAADKVVYWNDSANKVTEDSSAGKVFGITVTACSGDAALFAVRHIPTADKGMSGRVVARTADFTLTAADSGSIQTSVGATGTITASLPPATVGLEFKFRVGAAQQFRLDPNGTEVIALPSTGVAGAAGKYLVADADGETVYLVCTKAGQWSVFGFTGTWTAEA